MFFIFLSDPLLLLEFCFLHPQILQHKISLPHKITCITKEGVDRQWGAHTVTHAKEQKHEVSGGPGAAIESCYKTVYCETGVCVHAYYCLCLIGTWHWRASLAMLLFFVIWLWVRCEEGRCKCIYTLSAGFNLPDWNGVNLGLHVMHNTKRAYMGKEKEVTKHNVSDVQPRLCFNLLVHLLLACVRTDSDPKIFFLQLRYLLCISKKHSVFLR